MPRCPNAGAGRGSYLLSSKLLPVKIGYLCPRNPYGESMPLTPEGYLRRREAIVNCSDLVPLSIQSPCGT